MLERYGGKRAVALRFLTPIQVGLSGRRKFTRPIEMQPSRFVFICAGNICRSPFAERVARKIGLESISMGLSADDGAPINAVAAAHALRRGIDLSMHSARRLDARQISSEDLVLAFELRQAESLETMLEGRGAAVRLLGSFVGPQLYHQHDPYGLADAYFTRCFDGIERSVHAIACFLNHRQWSASCES